MQRFNFPVVQPDPALEELRTELQAFLQEERNTGNFRPEPECWMASADPEFSRKMGKRGWIGLTWSSQYGGHDKTALERYIVTEETLRAGAPVGAHWIADRQHAPMLLEHGTEEQKLDILPRIAAGECYFAIGLSEPGAGSDLAAVKTTAEKVKDGWKVNGQKVWSSGAHISHYMVAILRTSPADGRNRHVGLSQIMIDLSLPGVTIKPIVDLSGDAHFNEVYFEDVIVPDDCLLGEEGGGWKQVTGELAMERSGPERFLSSYITLETALWQLTGKMGSDSQARLGKLIANLRTLRGMSWGIANLLHQGVSPETEAALVKDLGNRLENDLTQQVRAMLTDLPPEEWSPEMQRILNIGILRSPPNTLRGGTTEVMRGITARQLGLR
ncbi:acyl-CoA dehydrogenase family protein [Parasphingorhabdus halotolerans]|uniref:Acyl-CoA dehydrogenase n=1 Tax=Parasphingorhabdus halotolerans TaxID=2725558 RepID=A0A6H2DQK1_9SPHN|nr:acyl-CoA dehydrogenase family protein [Parasphingorhabdus halotolerans]QJB69946.1 acyl-CoA dehydrogenase [Parasphingorhabdus halotolerans]